MDLGPYASFIVTAYAAAAMIVVGLVAWVLIDRRRLVSEIEKMEAQGGGRRAERKSERSRLESRFGVARNEKEQPICERPCRLLAALCQDTNERRHLSHQKLA